MKIGFLREEMGVDMNHVPFHDLFSFCPPQDHQKLDQCHHQWNENKETNRLKAIIVASVLQCIYGGKLTLCPRNSSVTVKVSFLINHIFYIRFPAPSPLGHSFGRSTPPSTIIAGSSNPNQIWYLGMSFMFQSWASWCDRRCKFIQARSAQLIEK